LRRAALTGRQHQAPANRRKLSWTRKGRLLVGRCHPGILRRRVDWPPQRSGLRATERSFQRSLDLCRRFQRTFLVRDGATRESVITDVFPTRVSDDETALMQGGLVRRLSGAAERMVRNLSGGDRIPARNENWIPGGLGELTANGRNPVRTLSQG
jgi:hypothetical protein